MEKMCMMYLLTACESCLIMHALCCMCMCMIGVTMKFLLHDIVDVYVRLLLLEFIFRTFS